MKSAGEIASFLIRQDRPVAETILLRFAAELRELPFSRRDLFGLHFELYHLLYIIRESYGREGFYLHLDPMRIRLLSLPDGCCFYFAEEGTFCEEACSAHGRCGSHPSREKGLFPQFDPLREFYLNMENLSFVDDPLFERSLRGAAVYCFKQGAVSEALSFFGISVKNPGRALIVKKYRELAKAFHPDGQDGDERKMKQLNAHYDVLREAIPF